MVQTNNGFLDAVGRISEWRELKKAVEAMAYERFLSENYAGIEAVQYCWTHHQTMRTNTAWKKDARFALEDIQTIQKLVDYDYPEWAKNVPCPIFGLIDSDGLKPSAFRYFITLTTGTYWISPILKHYNDGGYWFFIAKNTNTPENYSFDAHAFDVRTLPQFFQTLGITDLTYEAYSMVDVRGGEDTTIGYAENMINRLKLVGAYIRKKHFSDIQALLDVAKKIQPEWTRQSYDETALTALRKTLVSLPITDATITTLNTTGKTTAVVELATTADKFRYIGVGKNKAQQTALLVKLATNIYAQSTEVKANNIDNMMKAYVRAKPHFNTIIKEIDALNGWAEADVQFRLVVKMKTMAMIVVMLANADWADSGFSKHTIEMQKASYKKYPDFAYRDDLKGSVLEKTEKQIVAQLLDCDDFIRAVFFTNPFTVESENGDMDRHILRKLKDWETMHPDLSAELLKTYSGYTDEIEFQVLMRIAHTLLYTLAETPIKDLRFYNNETCPSKADFMRMWESFRHTFSSNFWYRKEENFENRISAGTDFITIQTLTWKKNPKEKLGCPLPEKVEVWYDAREKSEMLGILHFVWHKNIFEEYMVRYDFANGKVLPQKIKIEYWASMTFPFVRESLFDFARTLTYSEGNPNGNVEIIPCYQQL